MKAIHGWDPEVEDGICAGSDAGQERRDGTGRKMAEPVLIGILPGKALNQLLHNERLGTDR